MATVTAAKNVGMAADMGAAVPTDRDLDKGPEIPLLQPLMGVVTSQMYLRVCCMPGEVDGSVQGRKPLRSLNSFLCM